MTHKSLYDVLLVERNATLDEIKLAFKKRALQVHPDKGGSKEAFHLVYQALETLADPLARKSYDHGLLSKPQGPQGAPQSAKRRRKAERRGPAATESHRRQPDVPKKKATRAKGSTASQSPQSPQSLQTRLLDQIRDLLKRLPRDARNEALSKEFSQKQRLILEKWMVDAVDASAEPSRPRPETMLDLVKAGHGNCTALALPGTKPGPQREARAGCKKRVGDVAGCIKKCYARGLRQDDGYIAMIKFDAVEMYSGLCDLPTALEILVILTSVKQKMMNRTTQHDSFDKRLHEALQSSAQDQGRDYGQLNIRFAVLQSAGFFLGPGLQVRSPVVRSVEKLGQLRSHLEPFRQYAKNVGSRSMYWWYSPPQLEDAWEGFQTAIADAWKLASVDSGPVLQKFRACHEASTDLRDRHMQLWERQHMAMQDKNKYRPKYLRTKTGKKRCNQLQLPRDDMQFLRKLLARWGRILQMEAQLADKERRKFLQQRKKQREERRRLEALKQKRMRQEERLKRETLRKKMRVDLTMEDILGFSNEKSYLSGGCAIQCRIVWHQ